MIHAYEIMQSLKGKRFQLTNEKSLQDEIYQVLLKEFPDAIIEKEFHFDEKNIIDFRIDNHLGIEVKIKGGKRSLYNQCARYCNFNEIQSLLLITTLSMGFPQEINNKECYMFKLAQAWL